MLEKLRGKRMLFGGDSLQMGQWLSFVCLVNSDLHYTARTMERSTTLSVFTATVSLRRGGPDPLPMMPRAIFLILLSFRKKNYS